MYIHVHVTSSFGDNSFGNFFQIKTYMYLQSYHRHVHVHVHVLTCTYTHVCCVESLSSFQSSLDFLRFFKVTPKSGQSPCTIVQ